MPGLGSEATPAPASGHGMAIPTPSTNGNARASVVPAAYMLLENSTTWMTTGATHAPASRAAMPPMVNASTNVPRGEAGFMPLEKREKSISNTSNIASASATKSTAMPTLNQGDALSVPNVPAVRMTSRPSTPYTTAMAPPYAAPSQKPRARANDRKVDGDHREHARRQIQREAAEEHEKHDRQRSAPFEPTLPPHALLGVAHEREE